MSKKVADERESQPPEGDLSVTALYTAETWKWGKLRGADLFSTPESRLVFRITNWALAIAKCFRWGLASLRISLLHRHLMIDRLVSDFQPDVVVEIASGLSRRGFTMSENSSLRYVEVDLPAVIARKRALIESHPNAKHASSRPNWILIAGDAREIDLFALIGNPERAVCIAEGLFMYLDQQQQHATWQRIAEALAGATAGMFVFDLVPHVEQPKPGLIGRSLESLMKRFTGGRGFEQDTRGREQVRAELLACGFDDVRLIEPRDVAEQWDLPFPRSKSQQLIFVCTV